MIDHPDASLQGQAALTVADDGIDDAAAARISRSIALTGEFMQEIFADPSILNDTPDGATVYLIPDDDPAFAEQVRQNAERARRHGQRVYVHHLHRAAP